MKKYLPLIFGLSYFFTAHLTAQSFAITVNGQVTEYSTHLSDYTDMNRVFVTLLSTDERDIYQGVLKMEISGNGFTIKSKQGLQSGVLVNLFRNVPLILTGIQLSELFNSDNLDFIGLDPNDFLNAGGRLPEGPVYFCFSVYDFNRQEVVSNKSCAIGYVSENMPPEILTPEEVVSFSTPQNLFFSWQPRHVGFFPVEYTLEIYEDNLDFGNDVIVNTTAPFFTKTLPLTTYLYTELDPILKAGQSYLIRVQAKDIMGHAIFENNGWSEIQPLFIEDAGGGDDNCPEPNNFGFTPLAENSVHLGWDEAVGVSSWSIFSNEGDTILLPGNTNFYDVSNLLPNQPYVFTLCANCPNDQQACTSLEITLSGTVDTSVCGVDLLASTQPLSDDAILVQWNQISQAHGFELSWQEVDTGASTQPSVPDRRQPDGVVPNPETDGGSSETLLLLPANTSEVEVDGLVLNKRYKFNLCKVCPDGSRECTSWVSIFEGVEDDCITGLNIARVDSTDTSLDLAWTYDEESISADGTFTLVWQVADGSLPADSMQLDYTGGSYTIQGLLPFYTYNLQVCAHCTEAYPVCRSLGTFGGCGAAYIPYLADLQGTTALIAWDIDSADVVLPTKIRFKPIASSQWDTTAIGDVILFDLGSLDLIAGQTAELRGLQSQLTYVAQIQTECGEDLWSDWSIPVTFCLECAVEDSLWVDSLTTNTANIIGIAQPNAIFYSFEYRIAGQSIWSVANDLSIPKLPLSQLQAETTYEVRMRYFCSRGTWSDYTITLNFTTHPACDPPQGITANPIYETAAGLSWVTEDNVMKTEIRYRLKPAGFYSFYTPPWNWETSLDSTVLLQNLSGGGVYRYQMRSICEANESEWTEVDQFTLLCAAPGLVEAGDISYESALIQLGQLPPTGQSYQIDYRLSGDASWRTASAVYGLGRLIELDDYSYYDVRAKSTCSSGAESGYSDTIQFFTPVKCLVPENLIADDIQPFSANVVWDETGTMMEWEIRIKDTSTPTPSAPAIPRDTRGGGVPQGIQPLGSGSSTNPYMSWQRFVTTEPEKLLENLDPNRTYKVVVRARCVDVGWTDYSEVMEFATLADCQQVEGLYADEVYQESARLNWSRANEFDTEYLVTVESLDSVLVNPSIPTSTTEQAIRTDRDGLLLPPTAPSSPTGNLVLGIYQDSTLTTELFATFEGLLPNTDYRFCVKTRCDNYGWTENTEWVEFHTDECAMPTEIVEESIDRSTMRISWTPDYGHNDYEFKYKLADDLGAEWVMVNTTQPFVEITDLLTNQIYDYQISEVCQGGTGMVSVPQDSFLMEKPSLNNGLYVCGLLTEVDLSNETPLPTLNPGDTIIAFDFLVSVTEATGGGGYFSGKGDINLPYFNKAKFSFAFDDIFVNDAYRMVGGYMEATGFGIEVLPPWADSLLSDIMDVLDVVDDVLQEEQINQLDSLMACCQDYLPPDLVNQIQGVLTCFDNAQTAQDSTACDGLLTALMETINGDLDEVVADLGEQIITSKALDYIRLAVQELEVIHTPTHPPALTDYNSNEAVYDEKYPLLEAPENPPQYAVESMELGRGSLSPPGDNGSSTDIVSYGQAVTSRQVLAKTLVEEEVYISTDAEVPDHPALKVYAELIREGDTDVFTPVRAGVVAGKTQEELVALAKTLLIQKVTFLVNN